MQTRKPKISEKNTQVSYEAMELEEQNNKKEIEFLK